MAAKAVHAWQSCGHPTPYGRQIYRNPVPPPLHAKVNKVYHGTCERNLGIQALREGKFRPIGRPIYFTPYPDIAAYYVRDTKGPILLELASPGPVKKDPHFNEYYFPSKPGPQEVFIVNGWEVSPEFMYYLYHQSEFSDPQLLERFKAVAQAIFNK
jgi:hypothetical protein